MADKVLSTESRAHLDDVVHQMGANGESDDAIQTVVNDFKQKYAAEPSFWEKHPSLASLARGAVDTLPAVGAVTGGILAAPLAAGTLNPLTGLAVEAGGVGLGTGAGRGARDLIAEGIGLDKPTTPTSKALRIGADTVVGAGTQAVLPGVIEAAKTPIRTMSEAGAQFTPEFMQKYISRAFPAPPAGLPRPSMVRSEVPARMSPIPSSVKDEMLRRATPTQTSMVPQQGPMGAPKPPASIEEALLNQQAGLRDTASRATIASHPGAYGEGGIMPNGITPTELRRPMPMSEAQMAPTNAAAIAETAAGPKAFVGTTPAKSAAQATADVANRRSLTGVSPTGVERRAPIQLDPASVAAVGGPPVERGPQVSLEGNIPKSKSRSSAPSATPQLSVSDVEAFGGNPNVKYTKFTQDMIDKIKANRASRHGIHYATAQMDAFNKSQGIDPITQAILDRTP